MHFIVQDICNKMHYLFKATIFFLFDLGGLPSSSINSPDSIANIKGLSYLSDYEVIRVCLGGAMQRVT